MKNPRFLEFVSRKWIFLFLIVLSTAKSEDQTGMPEAGLLCISDCETCPVICSPPPPPPPVNSKPPPLPPLQPLVHHHSPPQPYYFGSPPPFSLPEPPPPPPPPRRPTCPPPPAYTSWDKSPPPPPPKIIYIPGNQSPNVGVPKNYPYPYYYFYASKAASIPHRESIFYFLLLFISSFVLLR